MDSTCSDQVGGNDDDDDDEVDGLMGSGRSTAWNEATGVLSQLSLIGYRYSVHQTGGPLKFCDRAEVECLALKVIRAGFRWKLSQMLNREVA